jgi:hypothetical protein
MNEFFQIRVYPTDNGPHSSLVVVQHAFEELETILNLCFQCINAGKVENYLVNIFAQWLLVKLKCCQDDLPLRPAVDTRSLSFFFQLDPSYLVLSLQHVLHDFRLPKIRTEKEYYIDTDDRMKERICDANSSFFEELARLDKNTTDRKIIFKRAAENDSFDSLLIFRSDTEGTLPVVLFLDCSSRELVIENSIPKKSFEKLFQSDTVTNSILKFHNSTGYLQQSNPSAVIQALTTENYVYLYFTTEIFDETYQRQKEGKRYHIMNEAESMKYFTLIGEFYKVTKRAGGCRESRFRRFFSRRTFAGALKGFTSVARSVLKYLTPVKFKTVLSRATS